MRGGKRGTQTGCHLFFEIPNDNIRERERERIMPIVFYSEKEKFRI